MIKFVFFFCCLLLPVSYASETVYKKINSDGGVEFSDRKSIDSRKIKIRKPSTYKPTPLPSLVLPTKKLSPTFSYSLKVIQPIRDSTIINTSDVVVAILMSAPLKKGAGHQIRYQLAGQSIVSHRRSVTFKNIPRGTHSIKVSIIDKNGDVVSAVVSSHFHLKRFFKK